MSRLTSLHHLTILLFVFNLISYIRFEFSKDYNLKKKSKRKPVSLVKKKTQQEKNPYILDNIWKFVDFTES